jgi:phage gpG-like protein
MLTIDVKVDGLEGIKKLPKEWQAGFSKGFRRAMIFVEGKAKKRFGKPGNIKVRTGHYRRSISTSVKRIPSGMMGTLHGNVVYAAPHEYGATIFPKKGKYLRFPIRGRWVTVTKVVIPKRPLLTPSITENVDEVGEIIVDSILKETGSE